MKLSDEDLNVLCNQCSDVILKLEILKDSKNRTYKNMSQFILEESNDKRSRISKANDLVKYGFLTDEDFENIRMYIKNGFIDCDLNKSIKNIQPIKNAENINKPKSKKEVYKENKKKGIVCCPKCGSTSITTTNKKLSAKRGIVGAAAGSLINPLAGAAGAIAGGLSSKKMYNVCMNCGHKWKP